MTAMRSCRGRRAVRRSMSEIARGPPPTMTRSWVGCGGSSIVMSLTTLRGPTGGGGSDVDRVEGGLPGGSAGDRGRVGLRVWVLGCGEHRFVRDALYRLALGEAGHGLRPRPAA